MTQTPADFPRSFAAAFGAQDAQTLAALFTKGASFHLLTSTLAEGQDEIRRQLEAEFAGLSRMARLVTGKTTLQELVPNLQLLQQRYVVTGLRDESGAELPRIAALLTAVLRRDQTGWHALNASFSLLED